MTYALVQLVRMYRLTLGPCFGGHCRFHPTCSQYAIDALQKHGPIKGAAKTIWRLLRCVAIFDRKLKYDPA